MFVINEYMTIKVISHEFMNLQCTDDCIMLKKLAPNFEKNSLERKKELQKNNASISDYRYKAVL